MTDTILQKPLPEKKTLKSKDLRVFAFACRRSLRAYPSVVFKLRTAGPTASFIRKLRGLSVTGYEGYSAGKRIVIYIANEGVYEGKVITAAIIK